MPTELTNEATLLDLRELGFFYDQDEAKNSWRLVGSKSGLGQFPKLLREFAANPARTSISQHDHYGPYMYLKVMTWDSAGIDENSIRGTIVDLKRLALLVDNQLANAKEGDVFLIRQEYDSKSMWSLRFEVRDDTFDPVSEDPELNRAS
jgi:hypothetical protein